MSKSLKSHGNGFTRKIAKVMGSKGRRPLRNRLVVFYLRPAPEQSEAIAVLRLSNRCDKQKKADPMPLIGRDAEYYRVAVGAELMIVWGNYRLRPLTKDMSPVRDFKKQHSGSMPECC